MRTPRLRGAGGYPIVILPIRAQSNLTRLIRYHLTVFLTIVGRSSLHSIWAIIWMALLLRHCKNVICQTCSKLQHWQCLSCQRRERLSAGQHLIQSYPCTSGFSNTITLQRRITTTAVARRSCRTHENCMHAEQIIIFFYIYIYIYIYIYFLYVFGIVFNCIIQNNSYCLHRQYFPI